MEKLQTTTCIAAEYDLLSTEAKTKLWLRKTVSTQGRSGPIGLLNFAIRNH